MTERVWGPSCSGSGRRVGARPFSKAECPSCLRTINVGWNGRLNRHGQRLLTGDTTSPLFALPEALARAAIEDEMGG